MISSVFENIKSASYLKGFTRRQLWKREKAQVDIFKVCDISYKKLYQFCNPRALTLCCTETVSEDFGKFAILFLIVIILYYFAKIIGNFSLG